ncbi:MAG: DUF1836 domain-containing protein [Lachnospiraceae bacterium]|nr:DUF1836 domain-containing protein [Lachnospiraceae bacterium]
MTINSGDMLSNILESLDRIEYVKPGEIPNIALYMDQVTTFMDTKLRSAVRNLEDDKVLTKTMINNYAKNDLLPPPEKKKYSKDHILLLIFIYYYKGILSISDIQILLEPITKKFFGDKTDFSLEDIYNEVFRLEKDQVERMKEDVKDKYKLAESTFGEAPKEDLDFLQTFSFICLLSLDVYVKKMIIENLVDEMRSKRETEKGKNHKEESKQEAK